MIFKYQRKKSDSPIKVKLSCKRLHLSKLVKYLGIKTNEIVNRKQHICDIAIQLNSQPTPNYVQLQIMLIDILRIIYFAIFDTHITYANLIWNENLNGVRRFVILQKKALRIMNFQSGDFYLSLLFKSNHILKLEDKVLIENF